MSDKALPQRETLLTLIETFREAEAPLLIHCKAGADRAGWPRRSTS
jgi:protein tyrosine/serine phosphatase